MKYLQKHVMTSLINITIYSAVASGRVRTSRDAVPNDRELLKLCHGNTGDKSIDGLNRAQFDALRAYRDGWKWSPFMPKLEGSATTPTTSRYRVPMPVQAATWDEPIWIARIVYTSTELEMLSAEFIVGFEHPRGTTFYSNEVFWRIMLVAGLDPAEWFTKHQSNDFGGVPYKKPAVFAFQSKGLRRCGAPLRDCGTLRTTTSRKPTSADCTSRRRSCSMAVTRKHACRAETSSLKSRSSITMWRRMPTKRVMLPSSTAWIRWHSRRSGRCLRRLTVSNSCHGDAGSLVHTDG